MPLRNKLLPAALFVAIAATPAAAEPLTSKTANVESPQTTPVGQLHFPFTHRFGVIGSKVTNSPTFQLSTGLAPATALAFRWASNSRLGGGTDAANPLHKAFGASNEFELSLKQALVSHGDAMPLDVTGVLGYNTLANSGDLALVTGFPLGPITLLATGKVFSNGYGAGLYTAAAGGGLQWHLTRYLQIQADVGGVLYAQNDPAIVLSSNTPAVSLGVGFEIPYTPHTALLYVSNADTHTLQGTSRGAPPASPFDPAKTAAGEQPGKLMGQILEQLRFGFEFNIPFTTLTRWAHIVAPPAPAGAESPVASVPAGTDGPHALLPAQSEATSSPEAPPAPPATPSLPVPGDSAPAGAVVPEQAITITGFAFKPATLTVPAGTVVRWLNKDTVAHTATSDKPGWDSGNLNPGQSYARKFDTPGTYAYHCTPHPFMVGKVVVK